MFFKTFVTLALATGFATAKPILNPGAVELPAYRRETPASVHKRGFSNNLNIFAQRTDFSFIDNFNSVNKQSQVLDIQQENLQIIDNGRQQIVVQQVKEVLVVNQRQNGFRNDMNNLFRKANFQNQFRDVTTVLLVVQEINVVVEGGRGDSLRESVFAQSMVVANRGRRASQTVMVFSQETLIAQNILGNNNGLGRGSRQSNDSIPIPSIPLPTATAGIQLFGAKPTWSAVAADPAATMGGIWQAAIQDAQAVRHNAKDNELNSQIAALEMQALDRARKVQG